MLRSVEWLRGKAFDERDNASRELLRGARAVLNQVVERSFHVGHRLGRPGDTQRGTR
jgi:hypothetical protein